jgi:unsaturated rhamnogalacturonyl hydrolase
MSLIEKVTKRMINGNDTEWNMNIDDFDWVPGVGLYGIWKAYETTKKAEYLEFLLNWADTHGKEAYTKKTINSMAPCLTMIELYRLTGKPEYKAICTDMAEYIVHQAPITVDGGLEHTVTEKGVSFSDQMWADTLFMSCIFLCRAGIIFENQGYIDFSINQLRLHFRYLWDEKEGLFFHGWDGSRKNHMSAVHWGRANAWVIISTVEILNNAGPFEEKEKITRILEKHIETLVKWQRRNGMYGTILDDPEAYDETSASAGITYGITCAVKNGYVAQSFEKYAVDTLKELGRYIDEEGNVLGVSTGTPIMATAEEYKKITTCPTLYGQGLMLMALSEV